MLKHISDRLDRLVFFEEVVGVHVSHHRSLLLGALAFDEVHAAEVVSIAHRFLG